MIFKTSSLIGSRNQPLRTNHSNRNKFPAEFCSVIKLISLIIRFATKIIPIWHKPNNATSCGLRLHLVKKRCIQKFWIKTISLLVLVIFILNRSIWKDRSVSIYSTKYSFLLFGSMSGQDTVFNSIDRVFMRRVQKVQLSTTSSIKKYLWVWNWEIFVEARGNPTLTSWFSVIGILVLWTCIREKRIIQTWHFIWMKPIHRQLKLMKKSTKYIVKWAHLFNFVK